MVSSVLDFSLSVVLYERCFYKDNDSLSFKGSFLRAKTTRPKGRSRISIKNLKLKDSVS